MTTTTNYNLKKPEYNDYADVEVLNENWDKVDEALGGHDLTAEAIAALEAIGWTAPEEES